MFASLFLLERGTNMDILEKRYVPLIKTYIVKERLLPYGNESICTPKKVVDMLSRLLRNVDREHFFAISIDTKGKPVGVEVVSIGTLNSTIVEVREVFKHAILCCASGIILAHNHPSGDPIPSKNDKQVTNRLREAGKILGIGVLDHVIIGDKDTYFSMAENEDW